MNRHRDRSGVTLTDVIVVLAVIGIALSLALPAIQASREDERRGVCAVRMKSLAMGFHMYHDNQNRFPSSAFYHDGQNLGDKKIALKKVVPGEDGQGPTRAPYSFFVKILPYVEQGYLFDQIDFKNREAFGKGNEPLAAKVVVVFSCPTFQADQHSSAKEYEKFSAGGDKPALSQYKALGATTLGVLQDAESATSPKGDGGILHPYAAYSINSLRAPTVTAWICETREDRYAAWWDGTTASIPGFTDKGTKATRPALATEPTAAPFLAKGTFGGGEAMQWGPSSEHPGKVNHTFGGTETMGLNVDIDPKVYAAMVTRRTDDNDDIGDFFNPRKETGKPKPPADSMKNAKSLAYGVASLEASRSQPVANLTADAAKPLLSWRVLVLPYIDANVLYDKFERKEPWNSEHNAALLPRMPDLFMTPAASEPNTTTWRLLPQNKNGIKLIDAGKGAAVRWTEPDELKIDPKNPLASLGEAPDDGYVVVYSDGRTARLRPAELAAALGDKANAGAATRPAPKPEKAAPQQPRDWHDAAGRKVEAVLVDVKDGNVTLRRSNGKTVTLPVARLSEADQEYLKSANRSAPEAAEPAAAEGAPAPLPAKVIKVSAQDYLKEFKADPAAAVAKYDQVTVEITGTCVGFHALLDDQKTPRFGVYLSGDGSKQLTENILLCCLADKSPWKQVAAGNDVTIRGVLASAAAFQLARRNLVDGKIVSRKSGRTPELTGAMLASAYAAKPEETAKKYDNQWIVVEGQVLGPVENFEQFVRLGTDKQNIAVDMGSRFNASELAKGEKAALIGQCHIVGSSDIKVQVWPAKRVDPFQAPSGAADKKHALPARVRQPHTEPMK